MLMFPFMVAAVLNVLISVAKPMQWDSKHLNGYCFLFGTPWVWLLDHGWVWNLIQNRTVDSILATLVLLWIPAALYSGCVWLILRLVRFGSHAAQ